MADEIRLPDPWLKRLRNVRESWSRGDAVVGAGMTGKEHARYIAAGVCMDLLAEIEGYDPDLGPEHPRKHMDEFEREARAMGRWEDRPFERGRDGF